MVAPAPTLATTRGESRESWRESWLKTMLRARFVSESSVFDSESTPSPKPHCDTMAPSKVNAKQNE